MLTHALLTSCLCPCSGHAESLSSRGRCGTPPLLPSLLLRTCPPLCGRACRCRCGPRHSLHARLCSPPNRGNGYCRGGGGHGRGRGSDKAPGSPEGAGGGECTGGGGERGDAECVLNGGCNGGCAGQHAGGSGWGVKARCVFNKQFHFELPIQGVG